MTGPVCKGLPPPARRPSQLPEAGKLKLHLSLGRKIGHGRVARVYEAVVDHVSSSSELQGMVLPPLVVKVSRSHDARQLAREAYYYDEMECLQGSVIPRYYGFFEATIPGNWDFGPWRRDPIVRGSRQCAHSDTESEFEDDDYRPRFDAADQDYSSDEEPPLPPPSVPTKVSILVMERLGDLMPLGKPLPDGTLRVISDSSLRILLVLTLPLVMTSYLFIAISRNSQSIMSISDIITFFAHPPLMALYHLYHHPSLSVLTTGG